MAFTILIFFTTRVDIKLYNLLAGPFHLKSGQVSEFITELSRDRTWLWSPFRNELVQAELIPESIINSERSQLVGDGERTLAWFRKIERPHFYLKTPTGQPDELFAAEHDFKLQLFSVKALQCLIRNLASKFPTLEGVWFEKQEMVKQLEAVRSADVAAFNAAAIRDCDLVVGFIFRALDNPELADNFLIYDVILDMTNQYISYKALLSLSLILILSLLATLYNLVMLLAISNKPFSINLSFCDQLHQLGFVGTPMEQLQTLDELLLNAAACDKFGKSLTVIKIQERWFVVVFNADLEKVSTFRGSTPVTIVPVADIEEIQTQKGINCDGIWIPWPRTNGTNSDIARWLHSKMEKWNISDYYRER